MKPFKLLLVCVGSCLLSGAAFGQVIYSTSFDNFTVGTISGQNSWTIPSGYGATTDFLIESTVTHSGTQALNLANDVGGGSSGYVRVRYALSQSLTPSYLTSQGKTGFWVDGYFLAPNTTDNASNGFSLQLTTGKGTVSYAFRTDNTVSKGTGATYTQGQWARLTVNVVLVDLGNSTYDEYAQLYLNGTLLSFSTGTYGGDATKLTLNASGNNLLGQDAASVAISQIGFGYYASANTGSGGYVDDFAISLSNPLATPEPRVAFMLVGGLLLGWARIRRLRCS